MKPTRANCIFSHNDFIYVVNFETMSMWVCFEGDEDDPVSTLDIQRTSTNKWNYRVVNADMEFIADNDKEFQIKLENNYSLYLNQLIAGKNARPSQNRDIPSETKQSGSLP